MLGDLHTPVSTYLKVRDIFPQSALMESSDYHGSENNRSFIALCPLASVSIDHGTAIFRLPDDSREEHPITDAYRVENALNDFRARFRVEGEYSNYCGLYGYTSFNAVRYFENIPVKDSREATNDAPDMLYILYKYLIVFNDFKNEMLLLEMLAPGETSGLDQVQKAIHNRNYTAYDFRAIGPTTSPLTDEEHKANIRRGIAHCLRGDVFQIVPPFRTALHGRRLQALPCPAQHQPFSLSVLFRLRGLPHFRLVPRNPLPHRRPPCLHRPHCRNHEAHRRCRAGRHQCPVPARRPQRERRTRDACGPCPQRPLPQLPRCKGGLL